MVYFATHQTQAPPGLPHRTHYCLFLCPASVLLTCSCYHHQPAWQHISLCSLGPSFRHHEILPLAQYSHRVFLLASSSPWVPIVPLMDTACIGLYQAQHLRFPLIVNIRGVRERVDLFWLISHWIPGSKLFLLWGSCQVVSPLTLQWCNLRLLGVHRCSVSEQTDGQATTSRHRLLAHSFPFHPIACHDLGMASAPNKKLHWTILASKFFHLQPSVCMIAPHRLLFSLVQWASHPYIICVQSKSNIFFCSFHLT